MNTTNIIPMNAATDIENEEFRRLFDSPRQQAARRRKMAALNRRREEAVRQEARTMARAWLMQGAAVALLGAFVGALIAFIL